MDLIERQAAIDAMCDACSDWCDEGVCKKVSVIQKLPSAQSEIIRCKDCRHNGSFDTDCPINWSGKEYCSFAERRTE